MRMHKDANIVSILFFIFFGFTFLGARKVTKEHALQKNC